MSKFETFEENPRDQLERDVVSNIQGAGYECVILESDEEKIRLSVTTIDNVGTGEDVHGDILEQLREDVRYLNGSNSRVIQHLPAGSYNIVIDCGGLLDQKNNSAEFNSIEEPTKTEELPIEQRKMYASINGYIEMNYDEFYTKTDIEGTTIIIRLNNTPWTEDDTDMIKVMTEQYASTFIHDQENNILKITSNRLN